MHQIQYTEEEEGDDILLGYNNMSDGTLDDECSIHSNNTNKREKLLVSHEKIVLL